MRTTSKRRKEVERTAVGVCQRKERERTTALAEEVVVGLGIYHLHSEHHVAREVVHREHNTLRRASSTRRVVKQAHLVVANLGKVYVIDAETTWICLAVVRHNVLHIVGELVALALVDDVVVGEREYCLDSGYLVALDVIPEVVAEEEQTALRVVDDVDDIGGVEVLKNRHNHCSVCYRGDVAHTPACIVTTDERNLIALLDACLLKHKV